MEGTGAANLMDVVAVQAAESMLKLNRSVSMVSARVRGASSGFEPPDPAQLAQAQFNFMQFPVARGGEN